MERIKHLKTTISDDSKIIPHFNHKNNFHLNFIYFTNKIHLYEKVIYWFYCDGTFCHIMAA